MDSPALSTLPPCARRPDLKLLISSATLDAEKFSEYFDYAPIFRQGLQYRVLMGSVAAAKDPDQHAVTGQLAKCRLSTFLVSRVRQRAGGLVCCSVVCSCCSSQRSPQLCPPVFFRIPGRRYPVDILYTKAPEVQLPVVRMHVVLPPAFFPQFSSPCSPSARFASLLLVSSPLILHFSFVFALPAEVQLTGVPAALPPRPTTSTQPWSPRCKST
jgi:hypothetical protein